MTLHIDIDRDKVRDYCRDESDDDRDDVVDEWTADLDAAGAEWSDDSSISGAEVGWCMTLRKAFWLALNRGWFSPEGYYQQPVGTTLASLLTITDAATGQEYEYDDLTPDQQKDAVRQVTAEWEKYKTVAVAIDEYAAAREKAGNDPNSLGDEDAEVNQWLDQLSRDEEAGKE